MKANVYSIITDKFIKALEQGEIAWQKPWRNAKGEAFYVSHTSGEAYSFLNCMLLAMQGGEVGEYLTGAQVIKEGGKIKKGAKAKMVVFFKRDVKEEEIKNEHGEDEKVEHVRFILRYYNVFHISETTGIKEKYAIKETTATTIQPLAEAEKIINEYVSREKTLQFCNDKESNEAFFSPSRDLVQVPMLAQYKIAEEYYSTTFHELVHSTGIEKRCARGIEKSVAHGGDDYSKEELVAEIGSAMCCNRTGIDNKKAFDNSVAYVQNWLKALKNDPKMIVWASIRAEKAVKYIFND